MREILFIYVNDPELLSSDISQMYIEEHRDTANGTKTITFYDEENGIIPIGVLSHSLLTTISSKLANSSRYYIFFSKIEWIKSNCVWNLSVHKKYTLSNHRKEQTFYF